MNKQESGKLGEDAALAYLMKKGYRLLARNYRARRCEIDLVMENEPYLVFVEVKARSNKDFGLGREAVTPVKQRNIVKAAEYFAVTHGMAERFIRFDVAEVDLAAGKITYIVDAFRC